VAYLWFFGVATMLALEARYVAWRVPIVKTTPTELPDQSIAQASGQKLNYFGYEFEIPWEIDEAKSKQVGQMHLVAFSLGQLTAGFKNGAQGICEGFPVDGKG